MLLCFHFKYVLSIDQAYTNLRDVKVLSETHLSHTSVFLVSFLTHLHPLTNYSNLSMADSLNFLPPIYNLVTKLQCWSNPILCH